MPNWEAYGARRTAWDDTVTLGLENEAAKEMARRRHAESFASSVQKMTDPYEEGRRIIAGQQEASQEELCAPAIAMPIDERYRRENLVHAMLNNGVPVDKIIENAKQLLRYITTGE